MQQNERVSKNYKVNESDRITLEKEKIRRVVITCSTKDISHPFFSKFKDFRGSKFKNSGRSIRGIKFNSLRCLFYLYVQLHKEW